MDMNGQEQNPAMVTVARNSRLRSKVWDHFTHFRDQGRSKAKCKNCNRVLAADTRNGTSSLLRHARSCNPLVGTGIETDERRESNQLTAGSTSVLGRRAWNSMSSLSFPSDLPPTFLPPAPPLGDPARPQGSSSNGEAYGLETAAEGAAPPPQPMSPMRTWSLSLPGSSMHDQDEEVVQKRVSDLEQQLCITSIDNNVQVMGAAAAPVCSVHEASAMNVVVSHAQEHIPALPCAPSRSGPAVGGSSESDQDSGLEEDEASRDLARMIALHGYESSFVEDDHFRSFLRRLNPEFEVPSRVAIENMCDGIFDEARKDLLDCLMRSPGKVSVAVGRAKTMEEQVLYVACHFIDDGWNLHKPLLHAIVTTDHHDDYDGPILGLHVSTSLGLQEENIFFLRQQLRQLEEDISQVISNHGIDDMLFMVADEKTYREINLADPNRKDVIFTTYVDNALHSIARCLLPESPDLSEIGVTVLCNMEDLRLTRQARLELLAELDLHYEWAYDEHWFAFYCSLKVLFKKGLPRELADEDLVTAKLLCKLWEKIYHAIKNISSSTRPTANLCLAELFKLREVLQHELARFSTGDDECDYLVKDASDTLDKAIEDFYLAWSLPLALDPRYKLKFITFNLERVYGLEAATEYISKVTTMITELYDNYVKQYGTAGGALHSDAASAMDTTTISSDDPLEQAWNEHCRPQQGMASIFYNPEAETELDRYLKDPLASQAADFDILNWWKAHSSEYPMVARMARDALAMPTCSKLSSYQLAQVRGILRAYSNKPYGAKPKEFIAPSSI